MLHISSCELDLQTPSQVHMFSSPLPFTFLGVLIHAWSLWAFDRLMDRDFPEAVGWVSMFSFVRSTAGADGQPWLCVSVNILACVSLHTAHPDHRDCLWPVPHNYQSPGWCLATVGAAGRGMEICLTYSRRHWDKGLGACARSASLQENISVRCDTQLCVCVVLAMCHLGTVLVWTKCFSESSRFLSSERGPDVRLCERCCP